MELCIWLLFVFLMSMLGASMIFVIKKETLNKNMSMMTGISAGVMLATTIWSLLIPAFEYGSNKFNVIISFILGFIILIILKAVFERFNECKIIEKNKTYFAITLHNIPEGLIIGVGFGVCALNDLSYGAVALAMAIGIQNFPESMALSILLKEKNVSNKKNILLNLISAIIEPIFGIVGYLLTYNIMTALGSILGFTAGMMLYVLISELIMNSLKESEINGIIGILIGFVLMMLLENFL